MNRFQKFFQVPAARSAWLAVSFAGAAFSADGNSLRIHGQGWTQAGRIMHVTDTLRGINLPVSSNLNGNWLQSSGAQFTAVSAIGDNWEGAFGFGGYQIYHSQGNAQQARTMRSAFQNFITEARMTYYRGEQSAPWLSLTFGNFAFNYNPEVKNLGLYLLRGPVYPGFLMSGFKDFRTDTTKGNVLGAHVHHTMGHFRHDLILANERELPPTFDWSVAYVAKYKAFGVLEFGGGVNLYRLLANNGGLTTPSSRFYGNDSSLFANGQASDLYDYQYIEVKGFDSTRVIDTVLNDTTWILKPRGTSYTLRGTKVMAMFNLDFKPLFGIPSAGVGDFRLYGEAAILGVQNYGTVYRDVFQRIPVMAGINIPTFGLLNHCSFELEWYGARYRNDLGKYGNPNSLTQPGAGLSPVPSLAPVPSPIPLSYQNYYGSGSKLDSLGRLVTATDTIQITGTAFDVENLTADNWKWSLYLEKMVLNHISFTAQIANDHFRPRPMATPINEQGGLAEAFSSPKDWYFMLRMGYFF